MLQTLSGRKIKILCCWLRDGTDKGMSRQYDYDDDYDDDVGGGG
jgi:hypothetical protein